MPQLKLSYFDIPGGRGEPARMALEMAAIPYEDDRIPWSEWTGRKAKMPYGAVPVLEVDGKQLAQSNAINRYVGKLAGLYPEDPWQAALCDELMECAEELGARVAATAGLRADALRSARLEMANGVITAFLAQFELRLAQAGGRWFCDGRLTMADLRVVMLLRPLMAGALEHLPADLPQRVAPALVGHSEWVRTEPRVAAYLSRQATRKQD